MMDTLTRGPRAVDFTACNLIYGMNQSGQPATIGLIGMVKELHIFESIFENTLSGYVVLTDMASLPDWVPFIGQEYLYVAFNRPGSTTPVTQLFRITKFDQRSWTTDERQQYTLHFVTPEFYQNQLLRFSSHFADQSCTDIVKSIFRTQFNGSAKTVNVDPTTQKVSLTIPNYTPFEAINFVASRTLSDDQRRANWLFWETVDGFEFQSVSTLILAAPVATVDYVQAGLTETAIQKYNHAESMYQPSGFDVLSNIASGFYRARLFVFDMMAGSYSVINSDYLTDFNARPHLTENPYNAQPLCLPVQVAAGQPDSHLMLVPSNLLIANSTAAKSYSRAPIGNNPSLSLRDKQLDATRLETIFEKRFRQLAELKQRVTHITIPGNESLRAGHVINLRYPTSRYSGTGDGNLGASPQSESTQRSDVYYTGKHLLTSIRHSIVADSAISFSYRVTAEAIKDAIEQAPLGRSV